MRTTTFFIFAYFSITHLFAQGNIVFATRAGQLLQVWINNTQTDVPNRYLRFDNMQPGNYLATVMVVLPEGVRLQQQATIILNNRYEVSYFVLVDNGKVELCLVNETPLVGSASFAPLNMCTDRPILSPQDIAKLQESVRQQMYDKRKLAMMKTAIPKAGVMMADVKTLILMLNSEYSRLQMAKFAYVHTCDKHNYHQLQDVFRYNSTMLDLKRYLNKQNK